MKIGKAVRRPGPGDPYVEFGSGDPDEEPVRWALAPDTKDALQAEVSRLTELPNVKVGLVTLQFAGDRIRINESRSSGVVVVMGEASGDDLREIIALCERALGVEK